MATTIPLEITSGKFPINYGNVSPYEFFKAFIRRLRGVVSRLKVIVGHTGFGAAPTEDKGPWFYSLSGAQRWLWWDKSIGDYTAVGQKVKFSGSQPYEITLTTDNDPIVTDGAELKLQNKSGTVLMLAETLAPRTTIILPIEGDDADNPNIDWTTSYDFTQRLTDNTTYTMSGAQNGMKISVAVENNGTNYTVTWPPSIKWKSPGTDPVQPTGLGGLGIYTFRKINGSFYGNFRDASPSVPVAEIPTGGSEILPRDYGRTPPAMKYPY